MISVNTKKSKDYLCGLEYNELSRLIGKVLTYGEELDERMYEFYRSVHKWKIFSMELEAMWHEVCECDNRHKSALEELKKEHEYILLNFVDEEDKDEKECYVYYILNQEKDKVKNGISNNPIERARKIQTASGEEIEIYHTIKFSSRSKALEAESYLHSHFSDNRKHPSKVAKSCEWFDAMICGTLNKYFWTEEQIKKAIIDKNHKAQIAMEAMSKMVIGA